MSTDESPEDYHLLFYSKLELPKKQMENLEKEKKQLQEYINMMKAKSLCLHTETSSEGIREHRKNIQDFLAEVKSQKQETVVVPDLLFDETKNLAFEKLYNDWYTNLKQVVEQQRDEVMIKINLWLEFLQSISIEDNLDLEEDENAEKKMKQKQKSKYFTPEEISNFKWLVFLFVFGAINSLFFYTAEDATACVLSPYLCFQNVSTHLVLSLGRGYFALHGIDIESLDLAPNSAADKIDQSSTVL